MRTTWARRGWWLALVAGLVVCGAPSGWAADRSCTRGDIADAIDRTGETLRKINADTFPALQAKMRQLKDIKGWSEADYQEQAAMLLQDARTEQLDVQSNDFLARIDSIGVERVEGAVACQRLDELEAITTELSVVMRTKASYATGRLEAMIAEAQAEKSRPRQAEAAPPAKTQSAAPARPSTPQRSETAVTAPAQAPTPGPPQTGWTAKTEAEVAAIAPPLAPPVPPAPSAEEGYSIDEIREASRGFFGQISTGLASVIEHAFRKSGRPVGYVLGNEGGGAFVAGLRYGKGTLYLRQGGTREVYWHGPSIGYDVGVAGSKTMFLIYNMKQPDDLFARFTGIDGSAYFVGGVGVTFLTNGSVVMAPIRSGLGLRFGANIGYVRFTPNQTWNPF
jgi:hypothetical protein